jgi:hypothetical protein
MNKGGYNIMLKVIKETINCTKNPHTTLYITNSSESRHLKVNIDSNKIENVNECSVNLNGYDAVIKYRGENYNIGMRSKDVMRYFHLL